jgi:hypothetical protein
MAFFGLAVLFLALAGAAFFALATGLDFFAFFAALGGDFLLLAIVGFLRLIKDSQNYGLTTKTKNII